MRYEILEFDGTRILLWRIAQLGNGLPEFEISRSHTHTNTPHTHTHKHTPHAHTHTHTHKHTQTHTQTHHTPHAVGLLRKSSHIVSEAPTYSTHSRAQETKVQTLSGIRNRYPYNQAVADLCLRAYAYRNWRNVY